MDGRRWAFRVYVAAAAVGGVAAVSLALTPGQQQLWHHLESKLTGHHIWVIAPLVALLTVTELLPVRVLHRRTETEVSTSTTITLALLLLAGIGPALAAQVVASFVADVVHRKGPVKIIFNASQYAIASACAGAVLWFLSPDGVAGAAPLVNGSMGIHDVGRITLAGLVFLAVNNVMVSVVASLATGGRILRRITDDWLFHLGNGLVLIGIAPLVDLVAVKSPSMIPLLLVPFGAVDFTARASLAQAHQALHDGLTGLANRTRFRAEVAAALDEPGRMRRPIAVLLIDLDRFKEINDTLGHHTGDVLLDQIGPRLASVGDDITLVARLGGDEFAVLIDDVAGPAAALAVAHRLLAALEQPFLLDDGLLLEVEASIGVVVTPEHGGDVDVLLQRADVAMYLAKSSRTGAELYAPERDENTRRRLTLIGQLRTAIANHELVLHYQPKFNVISGRFSGVEALVRWSHPEWGQVSPEEFIPLAERSGLIRPLTHFVLETAIRQARAWHDQGLFLRVAVNLSARTFLDQDLAPTVELLLQQAGLAPEWLELEITETELMSDPQRSARVFTRLHAMGIRLTIDDFGTGHSSLAYLRSLPVDEIKIDRSFIQAMAGGDRAGERAREGATADDIIVRSTIELAGNLRLQVTAEGVETLRQAEHLSALGCNYLQGFYLSRPVPAPELFSILAATAVLAGGDVRPDDADPVPC